MSVFTDSGGQSWEIRFSTGLLTRIKNNLGVNLFTAFAKPESLAGVLFDDPEAYAKILYGLCEKQATERGLSFEQFADLLDGETTEKTHRAFMEAYADFSPLSKTRAAMRGKVAQALDGIDDAMIQEMAKTST